MQLYLLRGGMGGYLCTLVNRGERGVDIWLSSNCLERGKESRWQRRLIRSDQGKKWQGGSVWD